MNEPTVMKIAFLILLGFAAPAPFAEAIAGVEEEAAVQCVRTARTASRTVPSPILLPRVAVEKSPSEVGSWELDAVLPRRTAIGWSPSHFTRPPPQA